jgi:predicted DsbA family dithiol-disulfide isomerase
MSREEYFPPHYLRRIELSPFAPLAEEEGLVMRSSKRVINSRRALAAAEFAREQDRFEPMHHALFKGYWEQTAELDSIDDLVRIGEEVGLDPGELRAALEAGRYEDLLDANRREAEQVGINAIPAHVFGLRYLVVGAHPYDVLKQVAEKTAEDSG